MSKKNYLYLLPILTIKCISSVSVLQLLAETVAPIFITLLLLSLLFFVSVNTLNVTQKKKYMDASPFSDSQFKWMVLGQNKLH